MGVVDSFFLFGVSYLVSQSVRIYLGGCIIEIGRLLWLLVGD